jgi:hypothetical protein
MPLLFAPTIGARRAADAEVLADAERLIAAWNERRARIRAPLPLGLLPRLPHHTRY